MPGAAFGVTIMRDRAEASLTVEPAEEVIPITIKIPGTLAEALRAHSRSSGDAIGKIVARALRRFFSDAGRHG